MMDLMNGSVQDTEPSPTPRLNQRLEAARAIARRSGHLGVGTEHVFLAILDDPDAIPTQLLQNMGVDIAEIVGALQATMDSAAYRTPSRRAVFLDGTTTE